MFKAITKGHRADVKRAEREGVAVEILYGGNFPEDMRLFRELHAKASGRITRSLETWQIQQRWVNDGHAFLALARKGDLVAGALFIVYEGRAYYASAARDPDAPNEGAAHLILWRAMQWLRRNGYSELDLGPLPGSGAAEKEIGVFRFKKGFGGALKLPVVDCAADRFPVARESTHDQNPSCDDPNDEQEHRNSDDDQHQFRQGFHAPRSIAP